MPACCLKFLVHVQYILSVSIVQSCRRINSSSYSVFSSSLADDGRDDARAPRRCTRTSCVVAARAGIDGRTDLREVLLDDIATMAAAVMVAGRRQLAAAACAQAVSAPSRLLQLRRHISSSAAAATEHGRPDHMDLTSEQERSSTLAGATIRKLNQLSPTVLGLELLVDEPDPLNESLPFRFAAGQWVDFHIPDIDTIGGYSITSLPEDLPVLELAVKASDHPPASWVTRQAKVGDRVQVRVGGDFVYGGPTGAHDDEVHRLLFIAGGVGINPLYAMIRQLHRGIDPSTPTKIVLLYSAGAVEELVFRSELDMMALPAREEGSCANGISKSENEGRLAMRVVYTTTQDCQQQHSDAKSGLRTGRIDCDMIGEAIAWLGTGSRSVCPTSVYVCGPPGMAEEMVDLCAQHAVPRESVRFESWW